ncbi:MAG: retropepsin-like aspartic protease [Ectothiorhodospiraceae bacterium]
MAGTERTSARAALIVGVLLTATVAVAQPRLDVRAIMGNQVMVEWQGDRHRLAVGDSVDGLSLEAVEDGEAVFTYQGERLRLGLSDRVGGEFSGGSSQEVRIQQDATGMYRTRGQINGQTSRLIVDTGANLVALGRAQAEQLGVDLKGATRRRVQTASGATTGYQVRLDSINVGGITVRNVRAMVLEGAGPPEPLLGMSYLGQVNLQQDDGVLVLRQAQ